MTEAFKMRASCTVRAFAAVTQADIGFAYKVAEKAGRKPGRGFRSMLLIGYAQRNLNMVFIRETPGRMTLKRFAREYNKGRYYVTIRQHALAIIDGEIMDGSKPGSIIRNAWRFAGEKE